MGTTNPSRRSQTTRKIDAESPLSAQEEVHGGRDHGNVIIENEEPKKHRQKRKRSTDNTKKFAHKGDKH